MEKLKTEIASLSADKSQLSESLKNLGEQNASMISKVNEFEKLNSDYLALKDAFNKIQSELAVTTANLDRLKELKEEAKEQNSELKALYEAQITDLRKANEDLNLRLEQALSLNNSKSDL